MAKTRKVVALGPKEELAYLRSAGVQFVPVGPEDDLGAALSRWAHDSSVGLILVSETVLDGRHGVAADVRRLTNTPIMAVPSHRGSADATLGFMKHTLEQSLGVDLISKS
jgi:vacuolar-type H+-ATPase subunit F/Vma7